MTTNQLPFTTRATPAHAGRGKQNASSVSPRVAILLSSLLVMLASSNTGIPTGPRVLTLVVAAFIMGVALLRPVIVEAQGGEPRAARVLVGALLVAALFITAGTVAQAIANMGTTMWFAVVLGYTITGLVAFHLWPRRLPHMRWIFFFLLVAHTAMTVALLRSSPAPIDVQVYLHDGVIRLFHGQNPYTMTIPNIYKSPFTEMFYGPGLVVNGRVPYGFPYLPAPLILAIPGYLLGDVRYAQLIAMLLTVLVLRRLASDRVGRAAAVLAIAAPTAIPMLTGSWTEPTLVALLACLILGLERHRDALVAVSLGLFLASKQYVVLAIPIIWLIQRSASRRVLLVGMGVAAAVITPFLLADPAAFFRSVLSIQRNTPFRRDSMSLLVWSVNEFGWPPPWTFGVLPLLVGGLTAIMLAIRAPRTPAAFAASFGLTLLVTVLLSRASFMNYYFLVSGSFLIAAVAWPTIREPASTNPGGSL